MARGLRRTTWTSGRNWGRGGGGVQEANQNAVQDASSLPELPPKCRFPLRCIDFQPKSAGFWMEPKRQQGKGQHGPEYPRTKRQIFIGNRTTQCAGELYDGTLLWHPILFSTLIRRRPALIRRPGNGPIGRACQFQLFRQGQLNPRIHVKQRESVFLFRGPWCFVDIKPPPLRFEDFVLWFRVWGEVWNDGSSSRLTTRANFVMAGS